MDQNDAHGKAVDMGYTAPSFPGSHFIPAILGTVVFVYGGLVFIRGAWRELADRKPGMMTLISLAIIVAFGTSLAATFGLFEIEVWWELASLITIMVLGHWLEMKAISQARGALNALAALLPDTAERVGGTETQTVPIAELHLDDIVLGPPLVNAIFQRQSTRAEYDGQSIPNDRLTQLARAADRSGARLLLFTEQAKIEGVLGYVSQGNSTQIRNPAFVKELNLHFAVGAVLLADRYGEAGKRAAANMVELDY